jgi:hypothetical protein
LKTEINGRGDPSRWPRDTLYPQKLTLARRPLGRYSSLADYKPRSLVFSLVRCTSVFLETCLRHSFGIPSSPQAFLSFNKFIIFPVPRGLTFWKGVSPTDGNSVWTLSPHVFHGFRHAGHEMWTGFLNNPQSRWLSRSVDMLFQKDHEVRLVRLVHLFLKGFFNCNRSL